MTFDPRRVQAVFLAALEQETLADRLSVLDRECANDEGLRRRVEALLIAHDRPDGLLDRPLLVPEEQSGAIRETIGDPTDQADPPVSRGASQP